MSTLRKRPAWQKTSLRLFADDAMLYDAISNKVHGDRLQDDVRQLEVWQSKCQMVFYPSKCKTTCISTLKVPPQRKYVFCGIELLSVFHIWIYYWMKIWSGPSTLHSFTSFRESKFLGILKIPLELSNKAIVRPKLEYSCAAWGPYISSRILLRLSGSREKRHGFAVTTITLQPVVKNCSKIYNPRQKSWDTK